MIEAWSAEALTVLANLETNLWRMSKQLDNKLTILAPEIAHRTVLILNGSPAKFCA